MLTANLLLPEIVITDWIRKLSEPAFGAWLRLRIWRERGELTIPMRQLIKKLEVSNHTFYNKILPSLWEHGLIEMYQPDRTKRCSSLIVYDFPKGLAENANLPLKRIRTYSSSLSCCFTDCTDSNFEKIPNEPIPKNNIFLNQNVPKTETFPDQNVLKTETLPNQNVPETETFPDQNVPETETLQNQNVPETETIPNQNVPETETFPNQNVPETETLPISEHPLSYLYNQDLLKEDKEKKEKDIKDKKDQIDRSSYSSSLSSLPLELQREIENNAKLHNHVSEILEIYQQFNNHPLFSLPIFIEKMNLCMEKVRIESNFKSYFQKTLLNLWKPFSSSKTSNFTVSRRTNILPEYIVRQEERRLSNYQKEPEEVPLEKKLEVQRLMRELGIVCPE